MTDTAPLYRQALQALQQQDLARAEALGQQLLTANPDQPGAHYIVGMTALESGQLATALKHLHHASRMAPEEPGFMAQLARALVSAGMTDQARFVADEAMKRQPADAAVLDTLGVVQARMHHHEQAAQAFRAAANKAPDQGGPCFHLATSLMALGRFDDARAALQQCLQRSPGHGLANMALSELGTAVDPQRIQVLQQQLQQQTTTDQHTPWLHMALSREQERNGDYPAAFEHLQTAHRLSAPAAAYDAQAEQHLLDALMDPDNLPPAGTGHDSQQPVFIIGMPRSGTTLVERILSSHPEVRSGGELYNFGIELKKATRSPTRELLDADTIRRAANLDMAALGKAYVDSTRQASQGALRFIDKLPHNFLYAGLIARALPQARIICLHRNPMDTCLGNFRQLFESKAPFLGYAFDLQNIARHYLHFRRLMSYWQQQLPERILEVDYEHLVADQEAESRRLIEFCGLDWDDACLHFEHNAAPVATASSIQVRSPIQRNSSPRWHNYRPQLAEIETLLGNAGIDVEAPREPLVASARPSATAQPVQASAKPPAAANATTTRDQDIEQRFAHAVQQGNRGQFVQAEQTLQAILAVRPEHAPARLRLFDAQLAQGNFQAADTTALKALEARPDKASLIVALMFRLQQVNETEAVLTCLELLPPARQMPKEQLAGVASILSTMGLPKRALEWLDQGDAEFQRFPAALLYRGECLGFLGRFDEAEQALEACIRRSPQYARPYWMLSRLRKVTPQNNQVARLKKRLARASDTVEKIQFGFTLHKELDDLGEHEAAWKALSDACALRRSIIEYSSEQTAQLIDQLMARSDQPFAGQVDNNPDGPIPIFIVGMHRSGTTLMERLLGNHGDITPGGELPDFPKQMQYATDHAGRMQMDAMLVEKSIDVDFAATGRRYIEQTRWRAEGKTFLTDKMPSNFLHLGFIARALPKARIIHMVRDPMDTCLSNLRELYHDVALYSYDQQELADYYLQYRRLMAHWQKTLPGRIIDVRYEDLTRHPEQTLRETMSGLEIPFQQSMLRQDTTAPIATASMSQARAPIHQRSIGGWRRYQRQLEPLCEALQNAND